jgi:hypothetical protein
LEGLVVNPCANILFVAAMNSIAKIIFFILKLFYFL